MVNDENFSLEMIRNFHFFFLCLTNRINLGGSPRGIAVVLGLKVKLCTVTRTTCVVRFRRSWSPFSSSSLSTSSSLVRMFARRYLYAYRPGREEEQVV